jgi:hypothetical protein
VSSYKKVATLYYLVLKAKNESWIVCIFDYLAGLALQYFFLSVVPSSADLLGLSSSSSDVVTGRPGLVFGSCKISDIVRPLTASNLQQNFINIIHQIMQVFIWNEIHTILRTIDTRIERKKKVVALILL